MKWYLIQRVDAAPEFLGRGRMYRSEHTLRFFDEEDNLSEFPATTWFSGLDGDDFAWWLQEFVAGYGGSRFMFSTVLNRMVETRKESERAFLGADPGYTDEITLPVTPSVQ